MTKYLYVSTNSSEVKHLINPYDVGFDIDPDTGTHIGRTRENEKILIRGINIETGEQLVDSVGFNPMSSLEMSDRIPSSQIESWIKQGLSRGWFVTLKDGRTTRQERPNDMYFRNKLVESWLRPGREGAFSLIFYSNDPNKIRQFET